MHKIYCLGYDGITCELHPTAQVYVGAGSVGQLFSDYLAENGRRIFILGQIPINGSVKLLGIPDLRRTSGTMFTDNLLALNDTTGWGDGGTSNHNWTLLPGGTYSMSSVTWSGAVPTRPAYMPLIP